MQNMKSHRYPEIICQLITIRNPKSRYEIHQKCRKRTNSMRKCEDPCRNQNPYSAMIEATLLHKASVEDFF